MTVLKILFQLFAAIFPWPIKRILFNNFFGFSLHKNSRIGYSIILCKKLEMDELSRIGNFNFINKIDKIKLGKDAGIGSFNYVTGMPSKNKKFFKHVENRKCELIMGAHSGITSRHFIDCTCGIYLDEYTTIIGIRTQIFTHSIDIYNNRQDASKINIGKYCLVGTNCTLLPGSSLPDYSILSAHSLLNKTHVEPLTLYGGTPAIKIKELEQNEIKYFSRTKGNVD